MLGHLGRHWIAAPDDCLSIPSDRVSRRHSFLAVAWGQKTGGRCPPVYPAYHVFNLSELATPNFNLGYWDQMRTVSVRHVGTDRVTPEPTFAETHETECLLRVNRVALTARPSCVATAEVASPCSHLANPELQKV